MTKRQPAPPKARRKRVLLCPAYWNKRSDGWVLLDHYAKDEKNARIVARQNDARLVWFRCTEILPPRGRKARKP